MKDIVPVFKVSASGLQVSGANFKIILRSFDE